MRIYIRHGSTVPTLPNVSGVVRVSVIQIVDADVDVTTRFYIHYTGTAPTNADLNTFCAAVRTAWTTNLRAQVRTTFSLREVTAQDLSSPTGATGLDTTSVPGTKTGTLIGAQMCVVVSYQIARRYRGGHPRGYWSMGQSADLGNSQTWAPGFTSAVQSGIDAFFTAVLAAGWSGAGTLTQVNVSYYDGFSVVTNPLTGRARNVPTLRSTPVVDSVIARKVQAAVGTQRRRG